MDPYLVFLFWMSLYSCLVFVVIRCWPELRDGYRDLARWWDGLDRRARARWFIDEAQRNRALADRAAEQGHPLTAGQYRTVARDFESEAVRLSTHHKE